MPLEEITLYPRRGKTLGLLALSLGLVVGCAWLIGQGDRVIGYAGVVFFGLGVFLFLAQLVPGSSYLKLTAQGFEVSTVFRKWKVAWEDVSEFGIATMTQGGFKVQDMVGFNYASAVDQSKKMRAMSRALAGYEGGLPDGYGLKAEELLKLLQTYREKVLQNGNRG